MYINTKIKQLDPLTLICALRQALMSGVGMDRCDKQLKGYNLSRNEILYIKRECEAATTSAALSKLANLIENKQL